MKNFINTTIAIIAVIATCAMPVRAERFHGGGGGGLPPALGLGLMFGMLGAAAIYSAHPEHRYYPYYQIPIVVQQPPQEIYVQPAPQQPAQSYWYYCQETQGYYPYVKRCPGGWMKVVPSPPPPQ
jgi:hypothetical protein